MKRTIAALVLTLTLVLTMVTVGCGPPKRATLEGIAMRAAEQALQEGGRVLLEPMTSVERKVVHEYLKEHDGVETSSEGAEPNRYVVVFPA